MWLVAGGVPEQKLEHKPGRAHKQGNLAGHGEAALRGEGVQSPARQLPRHRRAVLERAVDFSDRGEGEDRPVRRVPAGLHVQDVEAHFGKAPPVFRPRAQLWGQVHGNPEGQVGRGELSGPGRAGRLGRAPAGERPEQPRVCVRELRLRVHHAPYPRFCYLSLHDRGGRPLEEVGHFGHQAASVAPRDDLGGEGWGSANGPPSLFVAEARVHELLCVRAHRWGHLHVQGALQRFQNVHEGCH